MRETVVRFSFVRKLLNLYVQSVCGDEDNADKITGWSEQLRVNGHSVLGVLMGIMNAPAIKHVVRFLFKGMILNAKKNKAIHLKSLQNGVYKRYFDMDWLEPRQGHL